MSRKVSIGGNERTVPPVNTRKLILGTKIWSRIQHHLNDAMLEVARFSDTYRQLNRITITPSRAEGFGLGPEDFKGQAYIELPMPPAAEQQMAVGFAYVFEKAEDDVLRLCSLVLASRDDLREHRKAGDLDEWLLDGGEQLLDDAEEPEDLIEVFTEVVKQFRGRKRLEEALKNLRSGFSNRETPEGSQDDGSGMSSVTREPEHQRMEALVGDARPATWRDEEESQTNTDSSTSSPPDTTGPPTTSSMTSSGQT